MTKCEETEILLKHKQGWNDITHCLLRALWDRGIVLLLCVLSMDEKGKEKKMSC